MKRYNKPKMRIIEATINVICGSKHVPRREYIPHCDEYCRLWHMCKDRNRFKKCKDFQFKQQSMEKKKPKWKPGQLVTINRVVYRVRKRVPRRHSLFGAILTLSPCTVCCIGIADFSACDICSTHVGADCYLQPIRPKKSKGW